MRRSIYLLLALLLTLAVILPVTAEHNMLDQQSRKSAAALQGVESAWIVWETAAPVQSLALDGDTLWVGTYGGGLQSWDQARGYQETFTTGDGLPGSDVTGIARDGSGNLWVALLDGSVARSSDGTSFSNVTPPAPADHNAWAVAARGSNVWVGTLGGGVAQRVGSGWTLHSQEDSLPFDDIYAVGLESDGTPWVGTIGYGIAAYQGGAWVPYDPPLEIANPLSPAENVPNRAITDIAVDNAGVKWFATDGSGVAALDASDTNWIVYNTANSGLCGDFVQSVFLDSANNLWFGTLGGGVCRLGADRSGWTTYKSSNSPQPEDDVLDVVVDSGGGLWLAAYDAGLTYFGALPETAPMFDIDPRGEPDLGRVEGHGYLLWLDPGTFEWTLAWTGGSGSHSFEGSISAPGGLSLLEMVSLEAEDHVDLNGESLIIDASEGADWDLVTFALDHSVEELSIALLIDGAYYPYRIQLGGSGNIPGTVPFRIAAPQPQPPIVQTGEDLILSEGSYALLSGSYQDPDSPGGHSLLWDLGDGTTVEDTLSVSHVYVDDGVYTASLTVTDVHGLIGQDTLLVTVENVPPEVDFFHEPFLPSVGQKVVFKAMLFDPGVEDTHILTWDFGDGTLPIVGAELIVDHVFSAGGDYEVTLTATDDDGGEGETSYTLTVTANVAPALTMPDPVEALEGALISIPVSFSDPDSQSWTATVDYGDGTAPEENLLEAEGEFSLEHTYADNGEFTLMIDLTDDAGSTTEGEIVISVANVAPTAEPGVSPVTEEGAEINLALATFADPGFDCSDCDPVSLENFTANVDWGDGVIEEAYVEEAAGSPGVPTTGVLSGSHIYADNGAYLVSVEVCDDDLDCASTSLTVTVENVDPLVTIETEADDPIQEGDAITLPSTAFTDPGFDCPDCMPPTAEDFSASISWGEATAVGSVSETPGAPGLSTRGTVSGTHTYRDDGVFTVEVCVQDDDGGSGCGVVQVLVSNVVPSVEAGPDWQVHEGDPVDLGGASFSDPGFGEPYTAEVDWGDGKTESVSIAALDNQLIGDHSYADNGTYIVVIEVCDGLECGQDGFSVLVLNSPPVVTAGPEQKIDEGEGLYVSASFTDPGFDCPDCVPPTAEDFSASISWGEATADGLVSETPGTPGLSTRGTVSGTHTYGDDGTFTVEVCVQDDDGGEGCDSFTLTVDNLSPVVQPGADIDVDQGEHFTADLATFADPGVDDTHTATIDWGDETVEPGQVDQAAGVVSGSHTYLDPGLYSIAIEVCDDSGDCTSVVVPAEVRATPKGGIEAIKVAILDYIAQDEIDPKAETSMFSKLDAALKSLEKGNDHTAVNQLGAFINYVEAQRDKKVSVLAADDLIARAEAVISLIEDGAATLPRDLVDPASMCKLDEDMNLVRVRNQSSVPQAFEQWPS